MARLKEGNRMRATIARFVTAAVLTGAMLATGSAAHAGVTVADSGSAAGAAAPHTTRHAAPEGVGIQSWTTSCFGYTGTFKDASVVIEANYDYTGATEECFGIAPNRTIWHAWPNSGGWKQMPNNGRADNMAGWYKNGDGRVGVIVYVNSVGDYCSLRNQGPGWGGWFRC